MNPIDIRGDFARSMTQITGNPSAASQGRVSRSIELNDQLNKQIQMALAVNLRDTHRDIGVMVIASSQVRKRAVNRQG